MKLKFDLKESIKTPKTIEAIVDQWYYEDYKPKEDNPCFNMNQELIRSTVNHYRPDNLNTRRY